MSALPSLALTGTPVHIRSKKRSKPSSPSTSHPSTPPPARSQKLTHPQPTSTHPTTPHNPTTIETLPPELLEQIFLHTCNPSFPRSSLPIARKLSSEIIYRRFFNKTFRSYKHIVSAGTGPRERSMHTGLGPTWQYYCSRVGLEEGELRKARREGLGARWMTVERFGRYRGALLEGEGERLRGVMKEREAELAVRTLGLWVGEGVGVPRRLLRYPLDEVGRGLLDMLVQEGCTVDWEGSLEGEYATDALLGAVRARDYRMVHRYLEKGIMARPGLEELSAAVASTGWDPLLVRLIGMCLHNRSIPKGDASTRACFDVSLYDLLLVRAFAQHKGQSRNTLRLWGDTQLREEWHGCPCLKVTGGCRICRDMVPHPYTLRPMWHEPADWMTVETQETDRDAEFTTDI